MGCCHSRTEVLPRPSTQLKAVSESVSIQDLIRHSKRSIKEHYTTKRTLGAGGFGTVYLVQDKCTGALRAMKELQKSRLDPVASQKLLEEVETLRKLDHPHIMKVYELIETPRSYNIFTEYLAGGELFDKIVQLKQFDEVLAAKYTRELMCALAYLHSNRVVHRDLKPENLVLVSAAPESPLKLIDFGVSASLSASGSLREAIGSVLYMAPEVFTHDYNEKCDIWSAGVILFIMLSGRPPFYGHDNAAIRRAIDANNPDFEHSAWAAVSEGAKSLLKGMLAKDSKLRLSASDVLNSKWLAESAESRISEVLSRVALSNIGHFYVESKLDKTILLYISSKVLPTEGESGMSELFILLDKNNDGQLSKAELLAGFHSFGLPQSLDINRVMEQCDLDNSGHIGYSEFMTATKNWECLIQTEQLKTAFSTYSTDGTFSLNELKAKIPGIADTEWDTFLQQADTNGDNCISYEEFKNYLLNSLSA